MAGPSDEQDPLVALREGLSEDDPPRGGPAGGALPGKRSPSPPVMPRSAPPPLPRRMTTQPPKIRAVVSAGSIPTPDPSSLPAVPSSPPRAGDDPFQEPPEPRPSRGTPEEKLEYFRAVVKQKSETLARARALYAERETEVAELRTLATSLRTRAEDALSQLKAVSEFPAKYEASENALHDAQKRLNESEADRKDLTRALAEVEAHLGSIERELREEREARAASSDELFGAKEALQLAQERLAELTLEHTEMKDGLEHVREQQAKQQAELEARTRALADAHAQAFKKETAEKDLHARARAAQAEVQKMEEELEGQRRVNDDLRAALDEAERKRAELQAALERERELHDVAPEASPTNPSINHQIAQEAEQLRDEVQSLKRKLVTAERALEVAATLKSKLAKLEAQLKSRPR